MSQIEAHAGRLQRRGHPAHRGDEALPVGRDPASASRKPGNSEKRFGVEGDLFTKRQELIQSIQDRIYDAIEEVAGTSYVAIFDIGGQSNSILFASEKYDKSDSVLRKLGVRPAGVVTAMTMTAMAVVTRSPTWAAATPAAATRNVSPLRVVAPDLANPDEHTPER